MFDAFCDMQKLFYELSRGGILFCYHLKILWPNVLFFFCCTEVYCDNFVADFFCRNVIESIDQERNKTVRNVIPNRHTTKYLLEAAFERRKLREIVTYRFLSSPPKFSTVQSVLPASLEVWHKRVATLVARMQSCMTYKDFFNFARIASKRSEFKRWGR